MIKKLIYLDYAATTPVDPEVVFAMEPYWRDVSANPSSLHREGQAAIKAVDDARETIRFFVGAKSGREIIFTGSATEANNFAIFGVIHAIHSIGSTYGKAHVVTTAIEHASVLEPICALEKAGTIEATILSVDQDGRITPEAVTRAIRENTVLVSVGYANNEIGTIQLVADIVRAVRAKNLQTLIHTDAVQAAPFLDCDVKNLGVDLMTISAHKMYGPKGIGVLYVRDGVKLEPIIYGGGQEYGLRSGTENVPAIVGFAKAATLTKQWKENLENIRAMRELRDSTLEEIRKIVPGVELNGPQENRLPNNLNVFIPGVDPETFLVALSEEGICVSSGSACAARAAKHSHVIRALGRADKKGCHVRVTLGKKTVRGEIAIFVEIIKNISHVRER